MPVLFQVRNQPNGSCFLPDFLEEGQAPNQQAIKKERARRLASIASGRNTWRDTDTAHAFQPLLLFSEPRRASIEAINVATSPRKQVWLIFRLLKRP